MNCVARHFRLFVAIRADYVFGVEKEQVIAQQQIRRRDCVLGIEGVFIAIVAVADDV